MSETIKLVERTEGEKKAYYDGLAAGINMSITHLRTVIEALEHARKIMCDR